MRKRRIKASMLVLSLISFLASGCAIKRWIPFVSNNEPTVNQSLAERPDGSQGSVLSFGNGNKAEGGLNPQYVTEGDLLKIVNEFQNSAQRDTYRFPLPKDITGANVLKATLTRLKDYEDEHPGAYPELIEFTRARAYEGLHEYDKAVESYQQVTQTNSRLRDEATKGLAALTRFLQLKSQPITATTPLEYLKALDHNITAWQELVQEFAETPYATLAQEEEERLDWAKVAFLELNRHRLEDGNALVVLACQQLIAKHQESKNLYRYLVELGDFYTVLAHEYVAQNDPEGLRFDTNTFEELGQSALRLYGRVAQEDGIMEKLEARGKLAALEAYMAKVGRLSR